MKRQRLNPNPYEKPHRQRGAALLIVLVLIASLAFIAISITEKTRLSAARSLNAKVRVEAQWFGFGAEALAQSAIETALGVNATVNALEDPLFSRTIDAPLDFGSARIAVFDDTTCFNVNSLATSATTGESEEFGVGLTSAGDELVRLIQNAGLVQVPAEQIASTITDWIDVDTNRLPQGAEDEVYTTLPSPYRTGNVGLGSVSELRAMRGIDRDLYVSLKPFLCVLPSTDPSPINVNMLRDVHAPLLAAILGPETTVQQAQDIIAARPPGGYQTVAEFLAEPLIETLTPPGDLTLRLDVRSAFLRARAEIIYDTALLEMTSFFEIDASGEATLLRRRIGTEE